MDEQEIRRSERYRVAGHLKTVAPTLLHRDGADAVDGYVAASIIHLANTLETIAE